MDDTRPNGPEQPVDIRATIDLLLGILDKQNVMVRHVDSQTNILTGVSAGIFFLSISQLFNNNLIPVFSVLATFSGLSVLTGLLAIHPPKFLRKAGQVESKIYHRAITGFQDPLQYEKYLQTFTRSVDEIIKEFSREIFNIGKYSYKPKRVLFKTARNLLLGGIVLSILVFLAQLS